MFMLTLMLMLYITQMWDEVLLSGEWYHIDPCEAAVNEPLIYQGWGKKPTFVFAYEGTQILDVTLAYTDNATAVMERRAAEGVSQQYLEEYIATKAKELLSINGVA